MSDGMFVEPIDQLLTQMLLSRARPWTNGKSNRFQRNQRFRVMGAMFIYCLKMIGGIAEFVHHNIFLLEMLDG